MNQHTFADPSDYFLKITTQDGKEIIIEDYDYVKNIDNTLHYFKNNEVIAKGIFGISCKKYPKTV